MIRVSYKTEKYINTDEQNNDYYLKLKKHTYSKKATVMKKMLLRISKSMNIEDLFNELIKIDSFGKVFEGYLLKDIIILSADSMPAFIERIEKRISNLNPFSKKLFYIRLSVLFDYQAKFQSDTITPFFQDAFIFRTCYYCNRAYITDIEMKENEYKSTYQLDHYYEKSFYPYLALSFYNFIPCCSTCNSTVKNTMIKKKEDGCFTKKCIAPNHSSFNFDEKVKFETFNEFEPKDFTEIDLRLIEKDGEEYEEYIKLFKLNERYESHKDIVFEMIQRRKDFPDEKIVDISDMLSISTEKIKQALFGPELYDDLGHSPLSKLTKDISRDLGLLKEIKAK